MSTSHLPRVLVTGASGNVGTAPGWVDLAFAVPQLDTSRAREVLDWRPAINPARG